VVVGERVAVVGATVWGATPADRAAAAPADRTTGAGAVTRGVTGVGVIAGVAATEWSVVGARVVSDGLGVPGAGAASVADD
jgi:hypothetical protein